MPLENSFLSVKPPTTTQAKLETDFIVGGRDTHAASRNPRGIGGPWVHRLLLMLKISVVLVTL